MTSILFVETLTEEKSCLCRFFRNSKMKTESGKKKKKDLHDISNHLDIQTLLI